MTQQNTMPDELWVSTHPYYSVHLEKDNYDDTRYLRADAVEDEMAPVKGEKIKLKCDVEALEIKVKRLKAQRDDHLDLLKQARDYLDGVARDTYDNRLVCEIIHNIDKVLGEQNVT